MPLASGKKGASLMKKNNADQTLVQDEPFVRAGAAVGAGYYAGSGMVCGMLAVALLAGAAAGVWNSGMAFCLSFIVAGVACGVLQQLWFNWERAFAIGYGKRIAGFGLTYFPVLVACALLGSWLPVNVPGAWALFAALYLLILFVFTSVITRFLKRRGVEYQRDLAAYRERRAKGE